ncbi:hypothetical protein [Streptomyces sp. NBC_01465]|uniref:hypothetical protein n=1 Tax=Streptomyces sp. NBC_01465 TaxID=2903878 RepID=UPI002E35CE87|nr:hypothetical protein [Streptomyces sp. NBC_01465]
MTVTPTRIRLHCLAARRDGTEWIVGRMATGRFVALPDTGKRCLDLLGEGLGVAEVADRIQRESGEDIDVPDFVAALVDLGFVAAADGLPLPSEKVPAPALPRIRPRHVRWTLHPAVPAAIGLLIGAAVVAQVLHAPMSFNYRSLLWSSHGSLVIATGAAAGWALLLLHECAHLLTARATGVPGRMRLGTRLQFLVVQTDISGIELAPRRHRLTAYLAGIATNLTVAATGILLIPLTAPATTSHRLLSALTLLALVPLPFQLLVFMRTDLYFVVQDLTRCRDLYGDGTAYARYTARRLVRAALRRTAAEDDPSRELPAHERRAVRTYSMVLVVGTALCLLFLATVTLPADATLLARAVTALGPSHSWPRNLDAATVVVALGGVHLLWVRTWWRNRRTRKQM